MKSKFGFIPIVLPVLVMVLIIGLINMTGPQGAQAQTPPTVNVTFTVLGSDGMNLDNGIRFADENDAFGVPSGDLSNGNKIVGTAQTRVIELAEVGTEVTYNLTPGLVFSSDAEQVRITHDTKNSVASVTVNEIDIPEGTVGVRIGLKPGGHQIRIVGEDRAIPDAETLYLLGYTREISGPPELQSSDLQGEEYYFQADVAICGESPCPEIDGEPGPVTDFPLFPPIKSGTGNGSPTYSLVGIGVNGADKDLPGGITFRPPSDHVDGSGPDLTPSGDEYDGFGYLEGTPTLHASRSQDVHTMEYRVVDGDGDTSDADMVAIRFTITVGRDPDPTPSPGMDEEPDEPGPGQPKNIEILYTPVSEGVGTDEMSVTLVAADGTKDFRRNVHSYRASVPHDVTEAVLRVTVDSASTTASANEVLVDVIENDTTNCAGADPCYRWAPRKIDAEVANEYVILVTSEDEDGNDVTGTYEVDIRRLSDTKPEFAPADSGAINLHYYSGMLVSDAAAGDLPAVKLPLAAENTGNGATTTLVYTLEDKNELSRGTGLGSNLFLGLTYSGGNDADADTTTPPTNDPMPMLAGLVRPDLTGARDADVSSVFAKYTVRDRDLNRAAGDESSIDVNIHVYRDVTISDYTVGSVNVDDLDISTKEFDPSEGYTEQSYRFDDADISSYTHYVSHTLETTTFNVTKHSTDAEVTVTPPGGDATSKLPVELDLAVGDNLVTVEVTNGAVKATHVINIRRPGLTANSLTVSYYEDDAGFLYATGDAMAAVELSPDFDHENHGPYSGKVPTDVNSLRVGAEPKVEGAEVAVNDFKVNGESGFRVVDLAYGNNRIEVAIVDGPKSATYLLDIEREANTSPEFTSVQIDIPPLKADMEMSVVMLPLAMGGNGDLTYSLTEDELPPGVIFTVSEDDDGMTVVTLSGKPVLDEGFESDFDMVYTVTDSDSHTANDQDELEFTLRVTHGEVADPSDPSDPSDPDAGGYPAGEGPATLHDIEVTYTQMRNEVSVERMATLVPEFDPQTADYNVIVPHDNTGVNVKVTRTERDAKVTINNTRIDRGEKTILPPAATINVSHGAASMVYTLSINEGTDDTPSFTSTQGDLTFPIGDTINPVELPDAIGGNGDITYSLGDKQQQIIPDGLNFNANTRMLTGRPRLRDDAYRTTYQMVYKATDDDGSATTNDFLITICDPNSDKVGDDCKATVITPGPTKTETLTEWRSDDGTSATLTWTPDMMNGSAASYQYVFSVAKVAGTPVNGVDGLELDTFKYEPTITDGDTYMVELTGLMADRDYVYGVIALFGGPGNWSWGMWEIANYTP